VQGVFVDVRREKLQLDVEVVAIDVIQEQER
jgi:hypothetical protein